MVTLSRPFISVSSRLQYGQSASEKIASLREPSPLTFLIASSSGSESHATRFSCFMRCSVRLVRVAVSYTEPTIT